MRQTGQVLGLTWLCMFLLGTGVAHGQSGGTIVAWGWNDDGQCDVPAPNANFVAVAAGARHSLGLKSDGTIVAWGNNSCGQCDVLEPDEDYVAVAAGRYHSLGLKSDGTIVAWGENRDGQCDVPWGELDFVQIAGGIGHSLGLKSDGTIVAWGDDSYHQCDVPEGISDFVEIAAGVYHSLGLRADGTIVAWGDDSYHQCDVPEPNADFVAISGTWYSNRGLKSDGTIVAWGLNDYGQCDVPAPNADFVGVAAGRYHSLGLKSDGTILAWGRNNAGQRDVPAPNANFVAAAGGLYHSLGLKAPGYTPPGEDVVVSPVDPSTGAAPVTLTFDNVVEPGVTTLTISDQGPPPDSGFKLGNPPTYYDVTTTAVFDGSIEICIDYSGISFGNQANLKIAHWEVGHWETYDSTFHDTVNSLICARLPYLSPFAIFEPIPFAFDIKPGSCPNPINLTGLRDTPGGNGKDPGKSLNKGGVLPAAIVGSDGFDVTEVDVSTLLLEGIEPLRHAYEDVTRPVTDGGECSCTPEGPDGILDLTLKFSSKDIAGTIGEVEDGDVVPLTITGSLTDGTAFEASDCVLILTKGQDMPLVSPEDATAQRKLELGPVAPNPFSGVTRIAYSLPGSQHVKLSVYDAAGRLVRTLVEGVESPGEHVVEWDAGHVPSGIYFCKLEVGNEVKVKRIRLLK